MTASISPAAEPGASDTTPHAFSFTAPTGVAVNTVTTSNAITVAGINSAAAISVAGGAYSVDARTDECRLATPLRLV